MLQLSALGELTALARQHVDPDAGTIVVERSVLELPAGELGVRAAEVRRSVRVVTIPTVILDDVKIHLKEYGKTALLFAGATGAPIRRSNILSVHPGPAVARALLRDRADEFCRMLIETGEDRDRGRIS